MLRVIVVCCHFFFYPRICVAAKWSIDLQAPSVAHTYHMVLLPIQPHFCECLLLTWRCWFTVLRLAVHFDLPGSGTAVSLSCCYFHCLFKSGDWDLLFFIYFFLCSHTFNLSVCVSLCLSLFLCMTQRSSLHESICLSVSLSLSLSLSVGGLTSKAN